MEGGNTVSAVDTSTFAAPNHCLGIAAVGEENTIIPPVV